MTALAEYALLPIAFRVDQVLDVTARAEGGFALSARALEIPYVKDYDAVDGEGPLHWSRRFDVSNWTLFTARVAGSRVGGATVAFNTPGVTMLEGRRDLAVLWDIRVAPDARGKGIGSALFERVEAWTRRKVVVSSRSRRRISMWARASFMHGTGASCEGFTMPRILICRRRFNSCGRRIDRPRSRCGHAVPCQRRIRHRTIRAASVGTRWAPVVWAIDADRLRNYLVPRECPRVTYYAGRETTAADVERFLGSSPAVVAVESGWLEAPAVLSVVLLPPAAGDVRVP